MIIIKIIGGLGNQMFQYALGRRLAYENDIELKMDISAFEKTYRLHSYGLNNFNIDEKIATKEDISRYSRQIGIKNIREIKNIFIKVSDFFIPYYKQKYVREKDYTFDPNILKITDNVYLDGYWSSEKYFSDIATIIRKDFTLKRESDLINLNIADKIITTDSISIHFRRGDYVTDPRTNAIHGTCSMDYYYKAIEDICKYVSDPHFFIFSNDHVWVKENFSLPYQMYFITANGPEKNYEDLHLMSLCKHHIIANSTFSWWGAWLSTNKNKRVYTPKKWYNVGYINQKDMFPEPWHKI
jgi:hypothetical protein